MLSSGLAQPCSHDQTVTSNSLSQSNLGRKTRSRSNVMLERIAILRPAARTSRASASVSSLGRVHSRTP